MPVARLCSTFTALGAMGVLVSKNQQIRCNIAEDRFQILSNTAVETPYSPTPTIQRPTEHLGVVVVIGGAHDGGCFCCSCCCCSSSSSGWCHCFLLFVVAAVVLDPVGGATLCCLLLLFLLFLFLLVVPLFLVCCCCCWLLLSLALINLIKSLDLQTPNG